MKLVPFATFGRVDAPLGWTEAVDAGALDFASQLNIIPLLLDRWSLRGLKRINSYYNRHGTYIPDSRLFGKGDHWRCFDEDNAKTVNYMRGDCEDFALTKWRRISKLMKSLSCFQIAICFHKTKGPHAVLIVRVAQGGERGALVLDNLTSRVLPYQKTGLRFVAVSGPGGWQRVWA